MKIIVVLYLTDYRLLSMLMPLSKCFLILTAVSGFLSVALGAFAAHALKIRLDEYHMGVFRTGVEYQFFHTFALALVAILLQRGENPILQWSGVGFVVGILIFSGSLYTLALTGEKSWGAMTPLGGLSFLIAWALLLMGVLRMGVKE